MSVCLGDPQRLELAALGHVDYPPVHVPHLMSADDLLGDVDLGEVEVLTVRVQVLIEEAHGVDDVVRPWLVVSASRLIPNTRIYIDPPYARTKSNRSYLRSIRDDA